MSHGSIANQIANVTGPDPRGLAVALGILGLVAMAGGLFVLAIGFQVDQYRPRLSRWLASVRVRIRIRVARPVWVPPSARVLAFTSSSRPRTAPAAGQEGGR